MSSFDTFQNLIRSLLLFVLFPCVSWGCSWQTVVEPLFENTKCLSQPYGIHAHITRSGNKSDYNNYKKAIKVIKSLNINYVRPELDCPNIAPLNSDFIPNRFDSVIHELSINNINIIGLLSPLKWNMYNWEDTIAHYRYLDYIVERYKNSVNCWEILNEVDRYPDTLDVPVLYNGILRGSYSHIKKISSQLDVVYTGISWGKASLLPQTIMLGAADNFDIMNFHFYDVPEVLPVYLQVIKKNMDKYGWSKPVWITETGCSTVSSNPKHLSLIVDEKMQAHRLPRIFLIAFAYGVDKVFWYDLRSPEINPTNKEDHFGLTHWDFTPKPAYYAYKTLIKLCPDKSSRPELSVQGSTYIASWKTPRKKKIIAIWDSKKRGKYNLSNIKIDKIYDIYGNKLRIPQNHIIDISGSIVYVQIK